MIINAENSNNIDTELLISLPIREIECCPHCQSTWIIKYGKFENTQRHKCNDCERTFSATTNTPLYHSRKPIEYFGKFTELMLANTTLRDCANQLNINLKTAFSWRHKLLDSLTLITETTKLKDCIEMRKIFIRENKKVQKRQIENLGKKIWVIVSSDSNDDTFAKPISLGLWRKSNFTKLVYPKIHKNSYINTYGDSYIRAIASKHNQNKVEKNNYNSKELVYTFILNIKSIISDCRGVASKYLPHYFSLAKVNYSHL